MFLTWTTATGFVEERLICCGVQDEADFADEEGDIDEEAVDFTAKSLNTYLYDELLLLEIDLYEDIDFYAGDNCATNRCMAKQVTAEIAERKGRRNAHIVPLVGCRSHRLNKARQYVIDVDVEACNIVQDCKDVMTTARTLKNASKMRRLTEYRVEKCNATRFESVYNTLKKTKKIGNAFRLANLGQDVDDKLIPDQGRRKRKFDEILADQEIFQSVKLKLEYGGDKRCSLYESDILFAGLIAHFPNAAKHLAKDADIVYDTAFESAVSKIQCGREVELTTQEKVKVQRFLLDENELVANVAVQENYASPTDKNLAWSTNLLKAQQARDAVNL